MDATPVKARGYCDWGFLMKKGIRKGLSLLMACVMTVTITGGVVSAEGQSRRFSVYGDSGENTITVQSQIQQTGGPLEFSASLGQQIQRDYDQTLTVEVHNPSGLPEVTKIAKIEEPYILAQIITKSEFLGNVIKLCIDKRGVMKNQTFITQDRVEVNFDMPLSEIVFDFYDKLKSISKGYASFDYHRTGFQLSKLVKLDILLNGEPVDALSSLTYTDHAYDFGRKMCEKLKELIPRQQFDIAIQAAVGAKIIARETVKAVRKDVTAKCYGGDISRKRKLLEKQKKGKKRMRQIGNVEVPQSAFLAVLKMD